MADSKPQSYVEEMLTCSVCLDLVNEPRTLQNCFHSYCRTCVQQLLAKQANANPGVWCPVCRSFSKENEIRDNFFVNDLLQMHKSEQENQAGKKILCQQCVDDDPDIPVGEAKFKCLDCRISLCGRCHKAHLKVPILKGHRILPITQETELVIDRLVFCDIHDDEPVKFYCTECDQPICIQCKVTSHDLHKTETVDTALKRIIPGIDENIQSLDKNIETIEESIDTVVSKIFEIAEIYKKTSNDIKAKAITRIEQIKSAEKTLQSQLQAVKEKEINKLQTVKQDLENKKKEEDNMKRVAKTSIERARHASLLTELVKGGLKHNLERHNQQSPKPISVETKVPIYQDDVNVEKSSIQNGILGKIHFTSGTEKILVTKSSTMVKSRSQSRKWPENLLLSHIFSKPMTKLFEIPLDHYFFKSRIAVIFGNIWVADTSIGQVSIYDTMGNTIDKIPLKNPRTIEIYEKNIFFATKIGLYKSKISEYKVLTKLSDGAFSDLYIYDGHVYALEYTQKKAIILSAENDEWKVKSEIRLQYPGNLDYHDSLLVCTSDSNKMKVEIYITAFIRGDRIYKFNEIGKLVKIINTDNGQQYLCGLDNHSNILLADRNLNCVKILNMDDHSWTTMQYPAGLDRIVDVILDTTAEQPHIWTLQDKKLQKFAITL